MVIIEKKKTKSKNVVEVEDKNVWFHDLECYPNYFLEVFYNRDTEEIRYIEIHDKDNGELLTFLSTDPHLIGYNTIGYDSQINEFVKRNPGVTVEKIKEFSDLVISSQFPPFREYQLTNKYLDPMLVNNYGKYSAKSSSLKHLAYFFRFPSIADTPFPFNKPVTDRQKKEIIKYCIQDTEKTKKIYDESIDMISLRMSLGRIEGLNLLNSPEPRLAKEYFIRILSNKTGEPENIIKNSRTYRESIVVKDIIFPYIQFKTDQFKEIKEFYEEISLKATVKSKINPSKKCIVLKESISKEIEISGTEFVYKAGGIHACYKRGIYESNEEFVIMDVDYTSFYPKLAILNNFSPAHIDTDVFTSTLEDLFNKRNSYDKKTNFTLNYAYKILINIVYGLSNSEYGLFFDTEYTLKTCVNGMLTISMLLENILLEIENSLILQANTDGITVMLPRKHMDLFNKLLKDNEKYTGITLEKEEYDKMIIYDVNNYMAIANGKVKQKGIFETWETMYNNKFFHKNPSFNIIPIALNRYFFDNIPVEETIEGCNDIYEFLAEAKKTSNFLWLANTLNTGGVITSKIFEDRVVRYYIGGNSSVNKLWLKGTDDSGDPIPSGCTLLNASNPVTICQKIRNNNIVTKTRINYPDLDKEYYINEAKKIINEIRPVI